MQACMLRFIFACGSVLPFPALWPSQDHKLYKSRSFNYKGASSFTPRTSAPGTGTGFDPRAGFINNR